MAVLVGKPAPDFTAQTVMRDSTFKQQAIKLSDCSVPGRELGGRDASSEAIGRSAPMPRRSSSGAEAQLSPAIG